MKVHSKKSLVLNLSKTLLQVMKVLCLIAEEKSATKCHCSKAPIIISQANS